MGIMLKARPVQECNVFLIGHIPTTDIPLAIQSVIVHHVLINTFRVIDYFPAKTEEELVELGQFEYENDPPTQAPVAPNCRAKNGSCNRNDLCCSNRCKWRRCT